MGLHTSHTDRLALLVTAGVTAILARDAETRQSALDKRLRPMRAVIDGLERLHGPDAQPMDHPNDFASLVAQHGAHHLRERDVQLLQAAMVECIDRACAHSDALDDLVAAREASGETGQRFDGSGLLAWAGVSRERFLAEIETALRHPPA